MGAEVRLVLQRLAKKHDKYQSANIKVIQNPLEVYLTQANHAHIGETSKLG